MGYRYLFGIVGVVCALSLPASAQNHCGAGLAATDLAGNCRNRPNPTPGALEVMPPAINPPAPHSSPPAVKVQRI